MSAKSDSNIHPKPTSPAAPNPLLTFSQISESNVSKLIRSSPSKSCDLDPCSTQIVKDSADILAGPITMIINLSLAEGNFPDTLKIAHVTPLLKKPSLDRNELSNFRPVPEWFGIDGLVLQWVRSYLTVRSQLVKVNSALSTTQLLLCGVPQGSVLGPLLFVMYTTPLSSIITAFGLKHHLYADDTQIYTSFFAEDITKKKIYKKNVCWQSRFG